MNIFKQYNLTLIKITTLKQKICQILSGLERFNTLKSGSQLYQDKYFPTIGIRLPIPNALEETLKIGGV